MLRTITLRVVIVMLGYLLLIALVALVMTTNIFANRRSVAHLTEHTLIEVDANGDFNTLLNRAVAEAATFSRTGQARDREQVEALLQGAQASLATLNTSIIANDRLDNQRHSERLAVQQRRSILFDQVRRYVTDLLRADAANDNVGVERALAALDQLEEEGEQLEQDAHTLFEYDVAAVTAAFASGTRRGLFGLAGALTCFTLITAAAIWVLRRRVIEPIKALAHSASVITSGDLDQQIQVTSQDEIGALQHAFNMMIHDLRKQRAAIETRSAELQHSLAAQQQLFATVQQLSTPLLPLWEDVLVLPIVGYIDPARAAAMQETLLQGISQRRARHVILDMTGLVALDDVALRFLQQAVQAGGLLGAQVALAGVTSATAQAIVAQGLDLGAAHTFRDLHSAVQAALHATQTQAGGLRAPGALAFSGD